MFFVKNNIHMYIFSSGKGRGFGLFTNSKYDNYLRKEQEYTPEIFPAGNFNYENTFIGSTQMELLLTDILPPKHVLRRVDFDSPQYHLLRESISSVGLYQPVTVFINNKGHYELVDGGHRLQAHKDLGLKTITVHVVEVEDKTCTLLNQVIHNEHTVPLEREDLIKAVKTLVNKKKVNPNILAQKLGVPNGWIQKNLCLGKVYDRRMIELIDAGTVSFSKVESWMKLPSVHRTQFLNFIVSDTDAEFKDKVASVLRKRFANTKSMGEHPEGWSKFSTNFVGVEGVLKELDTKKAFKKRKGLTDTESAWRSALEWSIGIGEADKKRSIKRRKINTTKSKLKE